MEVKYVVAWAVVGTMAAAGAWDVYALYALTAADTVSAAVRQWAEELPVVPLLVGIILGHLFFPLPR
jgi:hypothetical protein